MKLYEKSVWCTWKKHKKNCNKYLQACQWPQCYDILSWMTPSYFEQNAVLPHPVHFFHVLIFHFSKQIIIWRMYGVIAEVLTIHWTTWTHGNLLHFPIPAIVYLPSIRSAILQDGVTRCYPMRFPAVKMSYHGFLFSRIETTIRRRINIAQDALS